MQIYFAHLLTTSNGQMYPWNPCSSAIGRGVIVLLRQLTTAGFRLISKYEYIVPQLSKCQRIVHVTGLVITSLL